jgi:hypothetical protein
VPIGAADRSTACALSRHSQFAWRIAAKEVGASTIGAGEYSKGAKVVSWTFGTVRASGATEVEPIDEVAAAADFICIGTNDLFAMVTGQDRKDAASVDTRALRMIERVITVAHARVRKVSVCGEMAGDGQGARILVGLGVDAISVATARFARVKLSLRDVTIDDCRGVAREALSNR